MIRKTGKELCVHEVLFQKDSSSSSTEDNVNGTNSHANLCPKISSEKVGFIIMYCIFLIFITNNVFCFDFFSW